MPKKASLDEILSAAENPAYYRVATAVVLPRQDLDDRYRQLDDALTAASLDSDRTLARSGELKRLATEMEELRAEMEAELVEFRFRSIGTQAWLDLLAKHPPPKQKVEEARRRGEVAPDHNEETFPVAAIAVSCFDPEGLTVDAVKRLRVAWNPAQFSRLWAACVDANTGGGEIPKASPAAGLILRASERFADTAENAASQGLISSAGSSE